MNQLRSMQSEPYVIRTKAPRFLKSPLFPPLAKGDDRGINAEELPEVVLSSPSIVGIRCSFRVEPSESPH